MVISQILFWFLTALSRDVNKIIEMVAKVSKGEAIAKNEVKRKDELGDLANQMIAMEGTIRSTLSSDVMRNL